MGVTRREMLAHTGVFATVAIAMGSRVYAETRPHVIYAETEGYHWMVPYVASAIGSWNDAGLDLETIPFATGRLGLDAVLAGKASFCISTDTPFIYAAMRGLKPRIVALFSTSTTGSQPLAVRADRIATPRDFSGKTVATQMGGGGHYFLTRFLAYHDVDPNDVAIINMPPTDMVTALVHGDVDAISWDAETGKAAEERGAGKVRVFDTSDSPKYFRQNCILTASDQVVNEQPEACDRAVKALQLAVAFIAKHPDKAVEFVAARTKTSTAESRQALTGFDHGLRFDQALLDDLVNQSEWAIESNLAKRPADDLAGFYRQLLYVEGLRKIDPIAVTLSE